MKAASPKKTFRRAVKRKPAIVRLAVKSTPKRAVRFSLVMVPVGLAALAIAFALSMIPSHVLVAKAYDGNGGGAQPQLPN